MESYCVRYFSTRLSYTLVVCIFKTLRYVYMSCPCWYGRACSIDCDLLWMKNLTLSCLGGLSVGGLSGENNSGVVICITSHDTGISPLYLYITIKLTHIYLWYSILTVFTLRSKKEKSLGKVKLNLMGNFTYQFLIQKYFL